MRVSHALGYHFVVVTTAALRSPGRVVIEARNQRDELIDEKVRPLRIAG